jgi:hypothetical protein
MLSLKKEESEFVLFTYESILINKFEIEILVMVMIINKFVGHLKSNKILRK